MRKSFYKKVIDWIDAHPFWAYVLGRKFNLWLGDKLLAVEKRSAKATSGLLVGIATSVKASGCWFFIYQPKGPKKCR